MIKIEERGRKKRKQIYVQQISMNNQEVKLLQSQKMIYGKQFCKMVANPN